MNLPPTLLPVDEPEAVVEPAAYAASAARGAGGLALRAPGAAGGSAAAGTGRDDPGRAAVRATLGSALPNEAAGWPLDDP